MRDEKLYLRNIQECIERIQSYTCDGKEVFLQTVIIQDAVIRNFEVIGEATKRLSPEIRAAYSDVSWQQIAGFRDVLIHDYRTYALTKLARYALREIRKKQAIASRYETEKRDN